MSSPNQRIITIMRNERSRSYFQVANTSFREAMYNLRANSFKLWCYLCDNQNKVLYLYPCDFCNVANVSVDTYRNAFDELEKKGYLVKDPDAKTKYWFMERSEEAEPIPTLTDLIETVDKEKNAEALQKALEKRREEKRNQT